MSKVATTIETIDGWTRMVYHNTCVAAYKNILNPERSTLQNIVKQVELNTGGYFTKTTKARMNEFSKMFDLGFSVFQSGGEWFVRLRNNDVLTFDNKVCEFVVE